MVVARERRKKGRLWAEGYRQDELDRAQEMFGLVFPPDRVALFRERRPVSGQDWRSDFVEIREMPERPFGGLIFDVENDDL